MVKHIILWKLKDELTEEQKAQVKQGILPMSMQQTHTSVPTLRSAPASTLKFRY